LEIGVKYKKPNPFYKRAAWLKCRELILQRDNYLCQDCLKDKVIRPADMVHHIEPLEDHPEKGLEESNLISLCHPCHNKMHPEKGNKAIKQHTKRRINIVKAKANRDCL
jgi:5-methylcytosine-specific restriction protein A